MVGVQWHSDELDVTNSTLFATDSSSLWLVAHAGVFHAGRAYSFSIVAAGVSGAIATDNVTVTTNNAPAGGILAVVPMHGNALRTVFSFDSQGWCDADGDLLNHAFAYLNSVGTQSGIYTETLAGANASSRAVLPCGNVTVVVTVTDSLGGASSATVQGVEVKLDDDVVTAVRNATDEVRSIIDAGGGEDAMALLSMSAESLIVATDAGKLDEDNLDGLQATLIRLALNSSRLFVQHTIGTVNLRAIALEQMLLIPSRMSEEVAYSAVQLASFIANASATLGSISDGTRRSLVASLSACVDSTFLGPTFDERRLAVVVGGRVTQIKDVLHHIHDLTLMDHSPGEAAVTTSAPSLALRSTQAKCAFGTCDSLVLPSAAFADAGTSDGNASFALSRTCLEEIARGSTYHGGQISHSLGMMAVSWKRNPHPSTGDTVVGSNASIAGLSITHRGSVVSVQNLSSRIFVSLPSNDEQKMEGRGSSTNKSITHNFTCNQTGDAFIVRCRATNKTTSHVCPSNDFMLNVTCDTRSHDVQTCSYFDSDSSSWRSEGIETVDVSRAGVSCMVSHLTDFSASMSRRVVAGFTVLRAVNGLSQQHIRRSWGVLVLVFGAYLTAGLLFWHDRINLRHRAKSIRQSIWSSSNLQASLEWLAEINAPQASWLKNKIDVFSPAAPNRSKQWMTDAVKQAKWIENGAVASRARVHQRLSPSRTLLLRDFKDAMRREHLVCAILSPNHSSLDRALIVLMRLIAFMYADALAFSMYSSSFRFDFAAEGAVSLFQETGRIVMKTVLLVFLVMPFKVLLLSALRDFEDRERVFSSIEQKLAADGLNRIDPSTHSLVDLRCGMLLCEALVAVARNQQIVLRTQQIVGLDEQRDRTALAIENAMKYRRGLQMQITRLSADRRAVKRSSLVQIHDERMNYLLHERKQGNMNGVLFAVAQAHCNLQKRWASFRISISPSREAALPTGKIRKLYGAATGSAADWEHSILECLPSEQVHLLVQTKVYDRRLRESPLPVRIAARRLLNWRRPLFGAISQDARGDLPPTPTWNLPAVKLCCSAIGVAFVIFGTMFIITFGIHQNSDEEKERNRSAALDLGRCLVVDLLFTSPMHLFIVHFVRPQLVVWVVHKTHLALERENIEAHGATTATGPSGFVAQRLASWLHRARLRIAARNTSLAQRHKVSSSTDMTAVDSFATYDLGDETNDEGVGEDQDYDFSRFFGSRRASAEEIDSLPDVHSHDDAVWVVGSWGQANPLHRDNATDLL